MTSAVAEKKKYTSVGSSLEASHMMLAQEVRDKKWFIRNEEIEAILAPLEIKWHLTVVQNSWEKHARKISWGVDTGKGAIHSTMQIMVQNCGAAVFHGIDGLNDYTFPISEFIAKNIASYTGTPTLMATGTAASGKRLEKLGWLVPIYAPSGRTPSKEMAYAMTHIPPEQMAKKSGFNYCYTTTEE
jgi:hypothetical protein